MHITKNFLVGTDHEDTQQVFFPGFNRVYRQRLLDALAINVIIDTSVGITGQVFKTGAACRHLIKPV